MDFETIRFERADGIATITLHRPERLNAWTPVMGREMAEAFRAADRDRDVRAVILTGAGRAFCAGADMDFFAGQIRGGGGTGAAGGDGPGRVEEFPALMQQMSKPTIAAINGYALGRRLHDDAALRRPPRRGRGEARLSLPAHGRDGRAGLHLPAAAPGRHRPRLRAHVHRQAVSGRRARAHRAW